MVHQRYKDYYYAVLSPLMRLNYYRYKNIYKWFLHKENLRLHLGCADKYFVGFINIDSNIFQKTDMWLDIRQGLPFSDQSVVAIYNSHLLEHFYPDECDLVLRECLRVLKKGAGIRIVVPNLRNAIYAYTENQNDWFNDWPKLYKSLGARFVNLIFCAGQHRNAFDFSHLEELLQDIGFSKVVEQKSGESFLFERELLLKYEAEKKPHLSVNLFVEAFK